MPVCHDCGVEEGQLHTMYCDMERCPFCFGQLASCSCCNEILDLYDQEKYTEETLFLPPKIFRGGLGFWKTRKWGKALREKGRLPYINFPGYLCAICGCTKEAFFRVSDGEWEQTVPLVLQEEVICKPCYRKLEVHIPQKIRFHCNRCGGIAEARHPIYHYRACHECWQFIAEAIDRVQGD